MKKKKQIKVKKLFKKLKENKGIIITAIVVFILISLLCLIAFTLYNHIIHPESNRSQSLERAKEFKAEYETKKRAALIARYGGEDTDWELQSYDCYYCARFRGRCYDAERLGATCTAKWKHHPTGMEANDNYIAPEDDISVPTDLFDFVFINRLTEQQHGFVKDIRRIISNHFSDKDVKILFFDESFVHGRCNRNEDGCHILANIDELRKPTWQMAYTIKIVIESENFKPRDYNEIINNTAEMVRQLILNKQYIGEYITFVVHIGNENFDNLMHVAGSWLGRRTREYLEFFDDPNKEQLCLTVIAGRRDFERCIEIEGY